MKLEQSAKRKKQSQKGNRFFTSRDMAIVKHDASVRNSKINRDELERFGTEIIRVCSCGKEGCFVHFGINRS